MGDELAVSEKSQDLVPEEELGLVGDLDGRLFRPGPRQCTLERRGAVAANGTDMGDPRSTSWIASFGAKRRLGTALVLAVVAFAVQPDSISWHTRAVVSWDLGTLAYLSLAWMLIGRSDPRVYP